MRSESWLFIAQLALASGTLTSTCLPDAVAVDQRRNLTNIAGESFPVGVAVFTWASAGLTSAMIEILTEEVLGYNTRVEPTPLSSSVQGMYATLGCATWYNADDRGCDNRKVRIHMVMDSWWTTFPNVIAALTEKYQGEMPISGGGMGYKGGAGMYVPRNVLDTGAAEGAAMEYYKSYNASWHQPWKYFDNVTVLNTSAEFMPCAATTMSHNSTAYNYWRVTGDDAGVVITGNTYSSYCPDGYTWVAPSCRSNPLTCIMFITGGDGWDVSQGLQRSAVFNIPLMIGVANSWANYLALPPKYKALIYWWTPDNSFLELDPQPFVLPPQDKFAYSQGDVTTASEDVDIAKVISFDLDFMAPNLVKLLGQSLISMDEVNDMMRTWKANSSASRHEVACDWLKNNEKRWRSWIPDPTVCNRGSGLYSEATGHFTATRAAADSCRACSPGMYSTPLQDNVGNTYVCQPCSAGIQQLSAGAVECDACPSGTFKAAQSVDECAPCLSGYYQDELGALACKKCPEGTTTLLLGTKSGLGCGCDEGSVDVSGDLSTPALCQPCLEGLTCPTMSTLENLKAGSSPLGPTTVPQVEAGYYTTAADPLVTFKCVNTLDCPGGTPGTCGGALEGVPCGDCPQGTFYAGEAACEQCSAGAIIAWIVSLGLVLLGLIWAYHFLNSPVTAKASTLFSTTCAIGMMINLLQNLGIIGTMSVPWPVNLAGFFSFMEVFTFDIDGLAFACISGAQPVWRYVFTVCFFPVGILWLAFCGAVSRCIPRLQSWDPVKVRSTIGQFLQVGFSTMSSTALVPLVCYSHPSGQRSNFKNPNIICGSESHTVMVIFGSLLLVFGVCGFLALCAWLAYMCPTFSSTGRYGMVQSSRFLLGRFRLDVWWYGVPLLLRGPLLAMSAVIFPDSAAIQILCCQIILIFYICLQVYSWPWKAPILNIVDFVTCLSLAILVVLTGLYVPEVTGDTLRAVQVCSMILLGIIFGVVGLMILLAIVALFHRAAIGSQQELWIMTAGRTPQPSSIAGDLHTMITVLNDMTVEELKDKLGTLGIYDLKHLLLGMSVLSSEVVSTKDASCRPTTVSSSRVSSKAFTAKVVKVPSTPAAAGHAMPAEEPAQDVDVNKSALV